MDKKLLTPVKLGALELSNRVVMAPLTRMRCQNPPNVPNDAVVTYYTQRATAGLIVSEATQISQQGCGYPFTPGIYSDDQVAGWERVTQSVHAAGGKMVAQLWHVGRISHSSLQPNAQLPVAPSPIAAAGKAFTASAQQVDFEQPRELTVADISDIQGDYRKAAENARRAGFDGVEIHSANGYLIDQFLHDGSNQRTDEYGGSIENRIRFLLAVVDDAIRIWGPGRVGVRLSPFGIANDMRDTDTLTLFTAVIDRLSERSLAYIHIIEPRSSGAGKTDNLDAKAPDVLAIFRDRTSSPIISAGGYTPDLAIDTVESGRADAIAFGRSYISNPDLVNRIRIGAPFTPYNRSTFYLGGEAGYTDYLPYSDKFSG